MYYSATDIASFRTLRETILIGPRGAFGVHAAELQARSRTELRTVIDRLLHFHGKGPELRASLSRWGLDPAVAVRREKSFLPAWLTDQAVRGAIAVIVVPDPTIAYAGLVDMEDEIIAAVRKAIMPKPMTVSPAGRRAIVAHEGIVSSRYLGADGTWRIGAGHRGVLGPPDPAFHAGEMPVPDALALLQRDLELCAREVTSSLEIAVEQHEFDALVSYHHGTGAFPRSEIASRLNNGDREGAADALLASPGHARERRVAEALLFRDGVYPTLAARQFTATPAGVVERSGGRTVDLVSLLGFGGHEGPRGALPPLLEERFIIALTRVAGRLAGDVREQFLGMLRTVGPGKIASSLLVWNADFVAQPLRMDLGLLAYDQASLSSEVVRATRALTTVLQDLEKIQGRDELAPVVDDLARAISVLIAHRLFDRMLLAVKIARGHAKQVDRAAKPSPPRAAPPRQVRAPVKKSAEIAVAPVLPKALPIDDGAVCARLARELAANSVASDRAALANAVYQEGERNLPEGWTPAGRDDLLELGLIESNGRDLTQIPGTKFKAEVFKHSKTGKYVVAYKGTEFTSMQDWKNNLQQGIGLESDYYSRAINIANIAEATKPGQVEHVGHSLGGGMASAASAVTGARAWIFNGAGLHPNTVSEFAPKEGDPPVEAIQVAGDVLSGVQDKSIGALPTAIGKRTVLQPASRFALSEAGIAALAGFLAGPIVGIAAGLAARGFRLHSMVSVMAALDKQARQIEARQKEEGCVP